MTERRKARAALSNDLTSGMVPDHVRYFRMERYRDIIAGTLREKPRDVFAAGMQAFYAWCHERHEWERQHGIDGPDHWEEHNRLLGATTGPDFGWICEEFDLPKTGYWMTNDKYQG